MLHLQLEIGCPHCAGRWGITKCSCWGTCAGGSGLRAVLSTKVCLRRLRTTVRRSQVLLTGHLRRLFRTVLHLQLEIGCPHCAGRWGITKCSCWGTCAGGSGLRAVLSTNVCLHRLRRTVSAPDGAPAPVVQDCASFAT